MKEQNKTHPALLKSHPEEAPGHADGLIAEAESPMIGATAKASRQKRSNLAWLTAYEAEYARLLAQLTTEEQAVVRDAPEDKRNAQISLAAYRHANATASAATQPAPALFPPGPWKAHRCTVYEADKWKDGNNEGGQFVACTVDPEFLEMPTDEMHARAVALAALPELLEACRAVMALGTEEDYAACTGPELACLNLLRAAIAKAEGAI